jgi:hypothetical protein
MTKRPLMPTDADKRTSDRAAQLLATADGQTSELIGLLTKGGEGGLRLPCPGREKMGDGTVGACALHTADRYRSIAGFLRATQMSRSRAGVVRVMHRISRFLPTRGHRFVRHGGAAQDHGSHGAHDSHSPGDGAYTASNVDLDALLARVSASRDALGVLSSLGDEQLDAVPPSGSFRFCDGQRTLEQVVASLLKHQRHQVEAIGAALASS